MERREHMGQILTLIGGTKLMARQHFSIILSPSSHHIYSSKNYWEPRSFLIEYRAHWESFAKIRLKLPQCIYPISILALAPTDLIICCSRVSQTPKELLFRRDVGSYSWAGGGRHLISLLLFVHIQIHGS